MEYRLNKGEKNREDVITCYNSPTERMGDENALSSDCERAIGGHHDHPSGKASYARRLLHHHYPCGRLPAHRQERQYA